MKLALSNLKPIQCSFDKKKFYTTIIYYYVVKSFYLFQTNRTIWILFSQFNIFIIKYPYFFFSSNSNSCNNSLILKPTGAENRHKIRYTFNIQLNALTRRKTSKRKINTTPISIHKSTIQSLLLTHSNIPQKNKRILFKAPDYPSLSARRRRAKAPQRWAFAATLFDITAGEFA